MAHLTLQQRREFNFEAEGETETWQGAFDDLDKMIDDIYADPVTDGGVYTGGSLARREADRGVLELTKKWCTGASWWGFSFAEISKPIKTWLALKIADEAALATELNKIDLWEQQRQNGGRGVANYLAFRYDNVHALEGFTLALAKKMRRGVESYSVYTPVATCRRVKTEPFTDSINSIGKYVTSLTSPSAQIPANEGQLAAFSGLRRYWLKTADSIDQNTDGTLSRTEQWTGYDDIDADLYDVVGGGGDDVGPT